MLLAKEKANRVVLNNISWQQFESLLLALGDRPGTRLGRSSSSDRNHPHILLVLGMLERQKDSSG